MQLKAKSTLSFLFVVILLVGCASKKRVDELTEELKGTRSEINQLKIDQQKTLECATKIALDAKSLVEIVGKIKNEASENKKQLETYGLKLNELEKELSMVKESYQAKHVDQSTNSNSLAKRSELRGVTLPDGTFVPNTVPKETVANVETQINPERQAFAIQKAYVASAKNSDFASWTLDMFQKMLIPGTTQEKVMEVMGSPDQESASGGWVYLGKVRNSITNKSSYLRIKFSDGKVISVESQ